MVSQVWEGVSRMTALAKQTTAAFLEGSVVLAQAPPGAFSRVCILAQMCGQKQRHDPQTDARIAPT